MWVGLPYSAFTSLAMPFDIVVLNDGTRVCLLPYISRSVSYRGAQFPALAFGTGTKFRGSVGPEIPWTVLTILLIPSHPCIRRTLHNTWNRPLRQVSFTSTQPHVTHHTPIMPTGRPNLTKNHSLRERRKRRGRAQAKWTCKVARVVFCPVD